MENVTIRKATFEDAAEIANVHINSWREAYKGLLSEEFLNERPLFFKNRYELWKKVTVNESQVTLVAECSKNGVVGFVNGTHGRDEALKDHAEVWCIYLLEKYHGQKIGFNLLKEFFDAHLKLGFKKGYLWVLDDNPTISFYEKVGGKPNGMTLEDSIGGQAVTELCYVWDSIDLAQG
jgi:ribosomal protein S18 acetylase RimI-like enzyme